MRTWQALSVLGISLLSLAACEDRSNEIALNPNVAIHNYGSSAGGGSLGMYTIRQGETVWQISQRYNLALRDVLDANDLNAPYTLSKGQRINLPAPQTYKVRPNDTLYTVSRMFNTSTTYLASLNKLNAPYKLNAGQMLRLPSKYKLAPVISQQVAMQVPDRSIPVKPAQKAPPASFGINDRGPLIPQTPQSGKYVPPVSSPSEYEDEKVSRPNAVESQPIVAVNSGKIIGKAPQREGKFIKPVAGKIISRYGPKADGLHNDGINIQAAKGDPVRAAESGVIVYTGNQISGYGNMILIRHADKYVSAYAHLDKTLVKKGDVVKRGQTVGTVGSSGAVDKPQLHFEIRKGTKALDPSDLVAL